MDRIRTSFLLALVVFAFSLRASELPTIGLVEFYGLKKVPLEKVKSQLRVHSGDPIPIDAPVGSLSAAAMRDAFGIPKDAPLPAIKAELENELKKVPGVKSAQLTAVCCEPDGTATLFVGIQELGTKGALFRPTPGLDISLPPAMIEAYEQFISALSEGVKTGTLKEDDSQGHALISGEPFERFQRDFIHFAKTDLPQLKNVLRNSKHAKDRAAAAWIVCYAANKADVANALSAAVNDSDELVRNNATRGLGTIAALAAAKPELQIHLDPKPFVAMLNSISWSDRNKATMVLLSLTQNRPPKLMKQLRQKALPSLVEMAQWNDTHSLMAFTLVARIARLKEKEIETAWKTVTRFQVIDSLGKTHPSRHSR